MAVGSCSKVWAVAVPARWQRTDETEVPGGRGVSHHTSGAQSNAE